VREVQREGAAFRIERRAPTQHGDRVEAAYFEVVWGLPTQICGHRHGSMRRANRCMDRLLGVA